MEKIRTDDDDVYEWDKLGFGAIATDYMYIMTCTIEENTFKDSKGKMIPYGNLEIDPSSSILNCGQGILEGLKAYRGEDNQIRLFRPKLNGQRFQMSAERLCMPSPSVDQFVDAVKQTVLANKRWIPPPGKGSIYLRPLLMGTGPVLTLGPALEYTFLIYATPAGSNTKGPLHFLVEEHIRRAVPGGTGGVKSITNYAPVYKPSREAKAKGYFDALFLDAQTGKYIEEGAASNIFVAKGNVISTPPIKGTILPGVTRRSIIEIAKDNGYQVEERLVPVEELFDADEAFCTGTAIVVKPIKSVTRGGKRVEYNIEGETICKKLHEILIGIQTGVIEDKKGWTIKIA